jgi:hypothetical protein
VIGNLGRLGDLHQFRTNAHSMPANRLRRSPPSGPRSCRPGRCSDQDRPPSPDELRGTARRAEPIRGIADGTAVSMDGGGRTDHRIARNWSGARRISTICHQSPDERPSGSPRNTCQVVVSGIEQHAHTVRIRLNGAPLPPRSQRDPNLPQPIKLGCGNGRRTIRATSNERRKCPECRAELPVTDWPRQRQVRGLPGVLAVGRLPCTAYCRAGRSRRSRSALEWSGPPANARSEDRSQTHDRASSAPVT